MGEKKKLKEAEAEIRKQANQLLSEETALNQIRNFLKISDEVKGQKGIQVFKEDNARHLKTLTTVYENESKLATKCNAFNEEILNNAARVERIIEMNVKDHEAIDNIVKELNTAHGLFVTAKDKEERAREATKMVRENFDELVNVTGAAMEPGEVGAESTMDILKKNGELMAELDRIRKELQQQTGDREVILAQQKMLEQLYNDATTLIKQLRVEMQQRDNEGKREQRRREQIERDMRQLKTDNDGKAGELRNMKALLDECSAENTKNEILLKDMKAQIDRQNKDASTFQESLRKLQHELGQQEILNANLNGDVRIKVAEIKTKEEEYVALKSEYLRLDRTIHQLKKKVKSTEEAKAVTEKHLDAKKVEIGILEKELDERKKFEEKSKTEFNEMAKENELMRKEIMKDQDDNSKMNETLLGFIANIGEKQKTIGELKNDLYKQSKHTVRLEAMRDEKQRFIQRLTNKQRRMDEDSFDIRQLLRESMGKIERLNREVRRLDGTREGLTKERNYASEHLLEAQDTLVERNKTLGLKLNQIEQLKEQTSHKDAFILKEELINKRLNKDYEKRKEELMGLRIKIKSLESKVSDEFNLKRVINKEIANAQLQVARNLADNKKLRNERDTLGSQLKRRNDEVKLLYAKIGILENVVRVGQHAYEQRLEDINTMRTEINRLNCCKFYMEKGLGSLEDMRREAYDLHQECLLLRARVRTLEEELEAPINIHRWRSLQGSDPERYELILKIQTLQKRLNQKSIDAMNSDRIIAEMRIQYDEMQQSLGRQPPPEAVHELSQCRRLLNRKQKQIQVESAITKAYKEVAEEMTEKNVHFKKKISETESKYKELKLQMKRMPTVEDVTCLSGIKDSKPTV